jgi:hypothetical protein
VVSFFKVSDVKACLLACAGAMADSHDQDPARPDQLKRAKELRSRFLLLKKELELILEKQQHQAVEQQLTRTGEGQAATKDAGVKSLLKAEEILQSLMDDLSSWESCK